MEKIKSIIAASIEVKNKILKDQRLLEMLQAVADEIVKCYGHDGKVLFCGNGGSAADAQHIAAELSGRLSDISRTGCYIDTLSPLAPGTQVHLRLRRGEELFETPARVVYVSPQLGMGLCWGKSPLEKNLAVLKHWLSHI